MCEGVAKGRILRLRAVDAGLARRIHAMQSDGLDRLSRTFTRRTFGRLKVL